jgi:colanic acid biosynthesis protein WcaH
MKLTYDDFKAIVHGTVLVSLDLLLVNERGEVLVGRRTRAPARNYLFVPGGRVMKGESLAVALQRVVKLETGLNLTVNDFVLHGIYDHIYDDSCFEDSGISTQYVVIACQCAVSSSASIVADWQHESLHFMSIADIIEDNEVHPYTKNYFHEHARNLFFRGGETTRCHLGISLAPDRAS